MTTNDRDDRLAMLAAAAEAEQKLIEAERDAEEVLKRAQARLKKIEVDFHALEDEVKQRRLAVKEARALLTAVQRQRAAGPKPTSS